MDAKFADLPNDLWKRVAPLLPPQRPKPKGGRPAVDDRIVFAGILYRLKTGCQWKALPREFGSGSTCHRRMQHWVGVGVFQRVFELLVKYYDTRKGVKLDWTSLDGAMVKAPKGGRHRPKSH